MDKHVSELKPGDRVQIDTKRRGVLGSADRTAIVVTEPFRPKPDGAWFFDGIETVIGRRARVTYCTAGTFTLV